jgi:hypothetical protein
MRGLEDLKSLALASDRVTLSIKSPHSFLIVSTTHDLSSKFLKGGKYDYAFHTHVWQAEGDVIDEIFDRPFDGAGDPSFAGVYDWRGGAMTREDTFAFVRNDMAFAVVLGADPIKDKEKLNDVFSGAQLFPVIILV